MPTAVHLSPHAMSPASPLQLFSTADAAAVAVAYDLLQDRNKSRDSNALSALLSSLGVACAIDLAHVDDAGMRDIVTLLRPAAASVFSVTLEAAAARARDSCFALLNDSSKHCDPSAMSAMLLQLGVSHAHDVAFIDGEQIGSIAALFKPVAGRAFVQGMRFARACLWGK